MLSAGSIAPSARIRSATRMSVAASAASDGARLVSSAMEAQAPVSAATRTSNRFEVALPTAVIEPMLPPSLSKKLKAAFERLRSGEENCRAKIHASRTANSTTIWWFDKHALHCGRHQTSSISYRWNGQQANTDRLGKKL